MRALDLGIGAFRCLVEACLHLLELELKCIQELRRAKGVKKEMKVEIRRLNAIAASLLEVEATKDKELFALIDERSGGYNEALADSACEMSNLNDIIYQGGYKFGLTCADILIDYELFSQPALCLPDFYTTTISSDSKEECESDEASFSAPLPKA
ncbi:hypothetical protein LguiB_031093 [Lonicera macranthoides]